MELWAIYPELLIAGAALLLVPVAGLAKGAWRKLPAFVAGAVFVAALVFSARMLWWAPFAIFKDTYAIDGFATVFKLLLELGGLITVLLLFGYFRDREQIAHAPIVVLLSTLGGMGLTSALDLGMIVLFLQMLSLASYVLVTLVRGDKLANEATLKYFIYAATALALMAYGLTFLFGLTGSLELRAIGHALPNADRVWIAVALALIFIGYAFEATLVPFHFWAPDVYHGSTAPIAGFLSVVPKIAAFAGLIRFLLLALPQGLIGWPALLAALAVLTMTFGNLVALRQTRLKRLLAYSSIAQAGYILIALAVADRVEGAISAVGYYLATYLFMNFGAFAVVAQLERGAGTDEIAALRGLGRSAPWPAAVLALSLLSLAGIPPLAGFIGKIFLLQATISGGLTWLAIVAAVNMVIGVYYYIAVVARIYFTRRGDQQVIGDGFAFNLSLAIALIGTLVLGIVPAPFLQLTQLLNRLLS